MKTCPQCGAPSLLSNKYGLCHFHAKEDEQRRIDAANRPACRCGNMTRLGSDRCGRCLERDHAREREAELEQERAEELEAKMVEVAQKVYDARVHELETALAAMTQERDALRLQLEKALLGASPGIGPDVEEMIQKEIRAANKLYWSALNDR